MTARVVVCTDGACSGGRIGGWAWIVVDPAAPEDLRELSGSGARADSTNNQMELWAVIEALRALPTDIEVEVVTDSAYVSNCFLQGWYRTWRRNGWRNSKKKPVENRDLWEELLRLVEGRPAPTLWTHVRGHQGHPGNEAADRLAVGARLAHAEANPC